jgi:hypothetical protein
VSRQAVGGVPSSEKPPSFVVLQLLEGLIVHPLMTFGIGLTARFVALLAEQFAQWVFHRVSEGAEAGFDLLAELWHFCRWFLRSTAGDFCGRSGRYRSDYEEEWQPGAYRR